MLTQSLNTSISSDQGRSGPVLQARPVLRLTGHAGLVATEFSYRKDEEIYGEDEPAEYVYQVIRGAVRTYKLLSDGRRQIGAFHLPGDVFGLESGTSHRLAAEAIIDTTVRLVKRSSLEQAADDRCPGRAQALGHDGRRTAACGKSHAACSGARTRWSASRISCSRWTAASPSPA